jgi:hypothetical protein
MEEKNKLVLKVIRRKGREITLEIKKETKRR